MKKKIFAVSDIHGHSSLLKKALEDAGFQKNDPYHLLVVCGDCFDRGRENYAVYEFLSSVKNKVLIRGNHEDLLMQALSDGYIDESDVGNGTDITVSEFFGEGSIDKYGCIRKKRNIYSKLKAFTDLFLDYFETENYVFVHGWVPTSTYVEKERWLDSWRRAPLFMWEESRFVGWHNAYRHGFTLPDKTIVCGHRTASLGYVFDSSRQKDDSSPFYGKGVIAIDACTAASGQVNVLVVEDEILESEIHEMKLFDQHFDEMKSGRKRYELRAFDDKRKKIKSGDIIVFSKSTDKNEKLKTKVDGIYLYEDFEALADDFKPRELGFSGARREKIVNYMNSVYGENKIKELGAVAIKIRLLEE